MASSSSLLSEDQFLCSVCLDVFTDPVTTPCGHNFCMTCLNEHWDRSEHCLCPLCKEQFNVRPELKINRMFREVVDHLRRRRDPVKPGKVPCDICTCERLKAVKSCLDCGLSFCETHLEPHKTAAKLRKHKLMDPVENLEDYICQKHDRPLELFCRDDQTCVCQFCTEGDHKTHNTVPLEEESEQRKSELGKTQTEVQKMIQDKLKKIKEIRHSEELRKASTERQIADSVEVFRSLIGCIERSQAELIELMEEKQKAAERQAEGLIKELEQEITELKRRDTELEQLSHSEDHLHLLQVYPTLCSPPHTTHSTDISIDPHLCVDTLREALEQLEKSFNEEMEKVPEIKMKRIKQYAVDVTVNPDTAHPSLFLTGNGKRVGHGDAPQRVCGNPQRFNCCVYALGKEGFSSGKFYHEVQVKGKTWWTLGVASEFSTRKGVITLSPDNGFWTVALEKGDEYSANGCRPICLSLSQKPQRVGVFVDYEEGRVSFYDVEASSHIYSFTGQTFTEKLYPFFGPGLSGGENSAPLIICL
ncbi:E3 ubiquitin-protein ligase TRIM39-like [Chanos chanos]|uniref:E3 ubiquitin-protein ligase TRIM39-like n=1 Tax=Chanos chanos TaxID=29144 RepID=A0A6J2VMX3_CHACN|nr:E3 ubiquitin-protein ligase TRIM39-like [Chanos chanos]